MSTKQSNHRAIADAAREATAKETRRACEIVRLCGEHGQPLQQAAQLILSGKSLEQCEAELKRAANAASWDKAIGEGQQQGAQGAPAAGWDTAVARANGQS
jgi:hypothetical protein